MTFISDCSDNTTGTYPAGNCKNNYKMCFDGALQDVVSYAMNLNLMNCIKYVIFGFSCLL